MNNQSDIASKRRYQLKNARFLTLAIVLVTVGAVLARVDAACFHCGKIYILSESGYGFARNHIGLCGQCRSPDNFKEDSQSSDGDREKGGEAETPEQSADNIRDLINNLTDKGSDPTLPKGTNPKRNEDTSQGTVKEIVNDLDRLLQNLNPGEPSFPSSDAGDNSPRGAGEKEFKKQSEAKEKAEQLKNNLDVLNGRRPQEKDKKGNNTHRQQDTNRKK